MYTNPVSHPVQVCGPVPTYSSAAQQPASRAPVQRDDDKFIAANPPVAAPQVKAPIPETQEKPVRAGIAERTMGLVHEAVDKVATFGTLIYRTTALQLGRLVAMLQNLLGRAEPAVKEKVGDFNEHASIHVRRAKNYVGTKAQDLSPKIHAALDEASEWLRSAGSSTPAVSMNELPFAKPILTAEQRHDEIAKRAAEKYRESGSMGGRDALNWLAAEAEYEADAVS